MSKFFNETRKVPQPGNRGPRPVGSELNIQELVGAVKESMEQRSNASANGPDAAPRPLLAPAGGDAIASQVANFRLRECRAVRLPRDHEKSFLAREYSADLQAAVEAYRTLRTRLLKMQSKTGMRSLAITSTAQGEGKTLTALNLALVFSQLQERTVLVVDGDLRTKGLSHLIGQQHTPGLGDILETGCPYSSVILRTDVPNLYVLSAGTSALPASELFSRDGWKEFVAWSGETFQMTLLDSPPVLDLADTELILGACEGLLVISRSGKTKRVALSKVLSQVDTKKLAGVVFNGCEEAAAKNYYRYSYGRPAQEPAPGLEQVRSTEPEPTKPEPTKP